MLNNTSSALTAPSAENQRTGEKNEDQRTPTLEVYKNEHV